MFFGTEALKADKRLSLATESSIVDFDSVVYKEYLNRKAMFEACNDMTQKPLLEAQVEVLCEASIKDLFKRIKDAIHDFIEWIKKIIKKVKDFFTGAKYKVAQEEVERLKSELNKANLNNLNLEKKIKEKESEILKLKREQLVKDKRHEDELASKDSSIEFQKNAKEDALKSHGETIKHLEAQLEKYENLEKELKDDLEPYMFFDARKYIRRDFSPQKLARCASEIVKNMNNYGDSTVESVKEWLDEYESYMYILNDETKKRLGDDSYLRHGRVDHSSMASICTEDMMDEVNKYKGKDLAEIYKRIETSDFTSTVWLSEIMDGYEIFAQNLMKIVEKEFDVHYSHNIGSDNGYEINRQKSVEAHYAKEEALQANELFQRVNGAIRLCKASVAACGTLINYEGKSLGACRSFMKTIEAVITNG